MRNDDGSFGMIDFEFSCVTHAISDFSWAGFMWMSSPGLKRRFFKKYCECMGDPTDDQYIEEIMLETEYYALVSNAFGNVSFYEIHRSDHPRYYFDFLKKAK